MNNLEQFVESWTGKGKRFATLGDLADALPMSLSAFSRGVKAEGTLSVENCLRLAEVTGVAPSQVLQIAKKADVAVLIERLYGKADFTPAESRLLRDYRAAPPADRLILQDLAKHFAKHLQQNPGAAQEKRRKNAAE